METLNPKPSVVRRYGVADLPDPEGDKAILTCGHYVFVPQGVETAIDCGECAYEAAGKPSAPRLVLANPYPSARYAQRLRDLEGAA